jgi:hypothetical protein
VYALILIIKAIIRTAPCSFSEKIFHIVLIETGGTNVLLVFLVIIVKFTALAVLRLLLCFHNISSIHIFEPVKAVLKYYLRRQRINDLLSFFTLCVMIKIIRRKGRKIHGAASFDPGHCPNSADGSLL